MSLDGIAPDLDISLLLDAYAPRAARYHIAKVDRPSPDLRDAVVLLTSELVTRAAQQCRSEGVVIGLRAWMPAHIVRVELHAPAGVLHGPSRVARPDYNRLLLEQIADRWSLEQSGDLTCMWFEIDRHPHAGEKARKEARGRPGARSRAPVQLG